VSSKLWQFSLQLYSKPEVKDACLTLQDKHNADVNLILFLLYQGSLHQQLPQETIKQIDDKTRSFRERVIQPIRELRKTLKGKQFGVEEGDASLYQDMLSFELSAEKLAQAHLETIEFVADSGQTPLQAATDNLYSYAKLLDIPHPNIAFETLLSHIES
jgi:uncharacterized protein (TIGR02444 family)